MKEYVYRGLNYGVKEVEGKYVVISLYEKTLMYVAESLPEAVKYIDDKQGEDDLEVMLMGYDFY